MPRKSTNANYAILSHKSLGYVTRNSVVVGANGCGKTSLANSLTAAMDYRDGIVIPAQKLLIIPTFASIPNYDAASREYNTILCLIFVINISGRLSSEKPIQVANYVSGQINHIFSEMRLSRGNSIDEVNQKFTEFIDQIDIDKLYNERETYIDDLISRKDYSQVINVYNNKGLCIIIEQELKIKSYYEKALRYLQDKDGVEGLEILKRAFPSALVN